MVVADDDAELRDLAQRLERAVTRICPSWLAASRDDLVQAALVKVLHWRRRREGSEGLASSYLWKVAHSALVDEIRRVRRRREEPLMKETWEVDPVVGDPGPESRALGTEMGEAIRACLQQMVEARKLAVTLHLQGHTVAEIAALLDWGPKRADNLVYRGLKDLRTCLRSKGWKP